MTCRSPSSAHGWRANGACCSVSIARHSRTWACARTSLVRAGELPEEPLATEVAAIDRKLIELEAKEREITQLQEDEDAKREAASDEDAVDTAFPMMGNDQSADPHDGPPTNPGPGWKATERFFRSDR